MSFINLHCRALSALYTLTVRIRVAMDLFTATRVSLTATMTLPASSVTTEITAPSTKPKFSKKRLVLSLPLIETTLTSSPGATMAKGIEPATGAKADPFIFPIGRPTVCVVIMITP
ncbi:hypothetical protein DSY2322 [Desulfitobacterium hafniense Y51]|uniref:Uncharacterized protein n=1 Tax=Desulfitobacterium hafniense (strain Y51) TaxID=138119 RepID=Q24V31_DESHY|nr:hypothetical protein DSY2322 [Desulfitobacterium hafniense Y51]